MRCVVSVFCSREKKRPTRGEHYFRLFQKKNKNMILFYYHYYAISVCLLFCIACNNKVTGFSSQRIITLTTPRRRRRLRTSPHYFMGLYDKPLPPRPPPPPPRDNDDDNDDDDEEEQIQVSSQLFRFNVQGKEANDLLPSLGRRLDKGIGCYFEPSDKLVQNLVDKTLCSVEDACWALEACKGDVTEAWTRISVARQNQLNSERDDDDDDLQEEFERNKQTRLEKERTRERLERMKRSKPDTDWLPIKNPKPIDDEPWFTG